MMHCSLLSILTRDTLIQAGVEVYLSQSISVTGAHKQGIGSKHPALVLAQTREQRLHLFARLLKDASVVTNTQL